MKLERDKVFYWTQWSWGIILVPLLAAGVVSIPKYKYSADELITIGLCGITAVIFSLKVMKVGFLYLTFDGCILIFLLTQTQNYFIVILIYLFTSTCVEVNKLIKYKRNNYESLVYYSIMPATCVFLAYNLVVRLPFQDIYVSNSSGFGILKAILTGYLVLLISLWVEYLNLYILRKKSYFLKINTYLTPIGMQSIDSSMTVVLILTFPFIGNVGLVMIFSLMLVILYLTYIYYEEVNLHGTFAKTVEALSESMELGSFDEKAQNLIQELAGIIKGCDCVLYIFDDKKSKQLPMIAAYHTMDNITVMDPEEYSIDVNKNKDFMRKLGAVSGDLYEAKTTSLAQLKDVGKRLTTARGFVATPIVGVTGVEGMLIVMSDLIHLNKNQTHGIVSVVGKQLSTKLINDTLFHRAEEHANRDSLTGLYSRRIFDHVISKYIEEDKAFSLALFDIDWFKSINDAYGHSFGDLVLQKVADILKLNSKGVDYACRYGGEELCIIFDRLNGDVAFSVAERIRETIQNTCISDGHSKPVNVTISGGVASFPRDGKTARQIIDAADKALYVECKQKGRNRVADAGKYDSNATYDETVQKLMA